METGKRNSGNPQLGNVVWMKTKVFQLKSKCLAVLDQDRQNRFLLINFDVRLSFGKINFINLLFIKMGLVM